MTLSVTDKKFLQRRRALLSQWRYAGALIILLCMGLCVWLFARSPLLINPYYVMQRIEASTMDPSTLIVSAVILPLMTLTVIGLVVVLTSLGYIGFSRERRLIAIIDKLTENEDAPA